MIELMVLVVMGLIMAAAGIYAAFCKKTINAVIASGVISLLASIVFLVLAAPDVAMTEATIGAGLTTVVFLYALKQVKGGDDD